MVSFLDGDWGWIEKGIDDDNYDVENDYEELNKHYRCDRCGNSFTLEEAASDFTSH